MIKYATALKQSAADPEAILRRFTRNKVQHPRYKALAKLGKVIKTIFLRRHTGFEELHQELHEGLYVVENWNSANSLKTTSFSFDLHGLLVKGYRVLQGNKEQPRLLAGFGNR